MSLEELDEYMKMARTLGEQKCILEAAGRIRHIEYETGEGYILALEDPERFYRVGTKTYNRKKGESYEEYRKVCIDNAIFLYERFPLIFEFYDELLNGITYTDDTKKVIQ